MNAHRGGYVSDVPISTVINNPPNRGQDVRPDRPRSPEDDPPLGLITEDEVFTGELLEIDSGPDRALILAAGVALGAVVAFAAQRLARP